MSLFYTPLSEIFSIFSFYILTPFFAFGIGRSFLSILKKYPVRGMFLAIAITQILFILLPIIAALGGAGTSLMMFPYYAYFLGFIINPMFLLVGVFLLLFVILSLVVIAVHGLVINLIVKIPLGDAFKIGTINLIMTESLLITINLIVHLFIPFAKF